METITGFSLGLGLLLLLVAGALGFVYRSLNGILIELCAGENRARFWLRLYSVSLVALVVLLTLFAPIDFTAERMAMADFIAMLRVGIVGLLVGLGVLALSIFGFVTQFERSKRRSSGTSIPPLG